MKNAVFLDSGIFIALLNRRVRWHPQAISLFDGPKPNWATSALVLAETYTWFLHRLGEEQARYFRLLTQNLPKLRVYDAAASDDQAVGKLLDRLRGSKLSYTDASSLMLMDRHSIRTVWSTDHHLGLTGAEVLPRV